jgi:hypothetical protein
MTNPRVKPGDDVHVREFDGELVLLDLRGGDYFGLDAIGKSLWVGLLEGLSVHEVASRLVEHYDVEIDVLEHDLQALYDKMLARGLIVELVSGDR